MATYSEIKIGISPKGTIWTRNLPTLTNKSESEQNDLSKSCPRRQIRSDVSLSFCVLSCFSRKSNIFCKNDLFNKKRTARYVCLSFFYPLTPAVILGCEDENNYFGCAFLNMCLILFGQIFDHMFGKGFDQKYSFTAVLRQKNSVLQLY